MMIALDMISPANLDTMELKSSVKNEDLGAGADFRSAMAKERQDVAGRTENNATAKAKTLVKDKRVESNKAHAKVETQDATVKNVTAKAQVEAANDEELALVEGEATTTEGASLADSAVVASNPEAVKDQASTFADNENKTVTDIYDLSASELDESGAWILSDADYNLGADEPETLDTNATVVQENESSESSKAKINAMGLKAEVEASAQNTIANGKEYAHTNANTVVGTKVSSEALDQALQAQVATDASKWQKLSAQDGKATATNENLAVLTSEDPTMPTEGKLDPSQILTSKKHALTTSANVKAEVSVEARDALKEAHKAGLKVVSSSGDATDAVLQAQAGDTLSFMVKMQQAARTSISEPLSSSSMITSILQRQNVASTTTTQDLKAQEQAELSSMLGDEAFENVTSHEASELGFFDSDGAPGFFGENGVQFTSAETLNTGADLSSNEAFAGVMSNNRQRAQVLAGTAATNRSSANAGFSGAENSATLTSNSLTGSSEVFGRVELLGGDRNGNAERIHQQVMKMAARNLRQVELELYPRNLGRLKISVSVDDGNRAAVNFTATTRAAKELLGDSLPKLKDYMAQAGVDLVDESVESTHDFQGERQEHESKGYARAQQSWQDSLRNQDSSANEAWLNIFSEGQNSFGNSLNSTFRGLKIAGM